MLVEVESVLTAHSVALVCMLVIKFRFAFAQALKYGAQQRMFQFRSCIVPSPFFLFPSDGRKKAV